MKTCIHLALALLALAAPGSAAEKGFREDLAKWRQERNARLLKEDGWLTLVGLHWLKPGENALGSDPSLPVFLDGKGIPTRAGVLVVAEGTVRFRPMPEGGVTLRGAPIPEEFSVKTDESGAPDLFQVGGLAFHVIHRKDRFAVRVKDPKIVPGPRSKEFPPFAPTRPSA